VGNLVSDIKGEQTLRAFGAVQRAEVRAGWRKWNNE
jgi:hypothetical protein